LDQRNEERAEKAIATGLGGGVAAIIVGILLCIFGLVAQMGLLIAFGSVVFVGGVIALALSLGTGLKRTRTSFDGPPSSYQDVKIVLRSAYDDRAQIVLSEFDMEQLDCRFYVKVELTPGNRIEFECARETFFTCGEGMRGDVSVRGKWLGQFIPAPIPVRTDE
jgi:hypothetical protein